MSRKRRTTKMKAVDIRPTYNSEEEKREALNRGALALAMIGAEYELRCSKKNSDEQDTA